MLRLLLAIVAVLFLAGGVFFIFNYQESQQTLLASDPGLALQTANNLLLYFVIAAIAALVLFVAVILVALSRNRSARRIAYRMSKDISLSQEQFKRFYELSPVPYLLVTSEGVIQRPNKATVRLFGAEKEALIGQNIFSYITTPENPQKIDIYREQVRRHVAIDQKEVQVLAPGGTPRWTLLSMAELSGADDGHKGLVTLVDIHERKELDRMKTEFLSLASHQLRAPLANLKWYIDFLLNRRAELLHEEVKGYLHKMYRRNEDMIDLVNTLLNLSRIEMGRIKVQKEATNLSEIAHGILEELEPEAQGKQITLETHFEENMVLETDGRLVRIILQNLLTNALRYTPEQGRVTLTMQPTAQGAQVRVTDTGIGIPQEEQGRIFQKLYRATNAKGMEANGNGIGLYMSKALAEGLGGSIAFESAEGKGTTFIVDIQN